MEEFEIVINGNIKEGDKIWLTDFINDNIEDLKIGNSIDIFITRKK